jgi:hypothetical protein
MLSQTNAIETYTNRLFYQFLRFEKIILGVLAVAVKIDFHEKGLSHPFQKVKGRMGFAHPQFFILIPTLGKSLSEAS